MGVDYRNVCAGDDVTKKDVIIYAGLGVIFVLIALCYVLEVM